MEFREFFVAPFFGFFVQSFEIFNLKFVANRPSPITLFRMLYFYNLRLYFYYLKGTKRCLKDFIK